MIKWNPGEGGAPKDRRLLLIATPKNMPVAYMEPDIVLGHSHGNDAFVPVKTPYTRGPTRPELNVHGGQRFPTNCFRKT
jgi:hypothetical protein